MSSQPQGHQTARSDASTGQPAPQDGHLPSALQRLEDAIAALCDPVQHMVDGHRRYTDSWYRQLRDSLPGNQRGEGGGSAPLPGCWLDALILLDEIDTAVACWHRQPGTTPERLHALHERGWRPQDCRQIGELAGNIEAWTRDIKSLLIVEKHWTLPAPCPACGATVVYRKDSAGEVVRQAALHIGPDGCECLRCHTVWEPARFVFLAKLLNYDKPVGVLE